MANGNYMVTMICFNWNPDLLAFKAVKGCSSLSDHLNKHENIEAIKPEKSQLVLPQPLPKLNLCC